MLRQNPDGSWDYVVNDGTKAVYQWDKNYFANPPLAKTDRSFSFNIPFVNHDMGFSIYDGIRSVVDKASVHASRIADATKQVARNAVQGVVTTASNVGGFVQSTLLKVVVVAVIVAVITLFIMSYTEAKAGRLANV